MFVDGATCHPFNDKGPHGFLRCEGTSTVVLRRLHDAESSGQRILCKVVRSVSGSAGPGEGVEEGPGRVYEAPCGYGMKKMFERAYLSVDLPLERVQYIGK